MSVGCLCKQKTAYEWRMSDWSSDVCSADLLEGAVGALAPGVGLGRFLPGRVDVLHLDRRVFLDDMDVHLLQQRRGGVGQPRLPLAGVVDVPEIGRTSRRERVVHSLEILGDPAPIKNTPKPQPPINTK